LKEYFIDEIVNTAIEESAYSPIILHKFAPNCIATQESVFRV